MSYKRILGIDLAVTAAHRAIVLDLPSNEFVSPVISFHATPADMENLLSSARTGAPLDVHLVTVLEATAMAWFTVGTYLIRHGVEVYRVNGRQTADQRKVFKRHAKSDRIDARILARLYLTSPEQLTRLVLPSPAHVELQRACREVARLTTSITASRNRINAIDEYAWLGLRTLFSPDSLQATFVRVHWYDPHQVVLSGVDLIRQAWLATQPPDDKLDWVDAFVAQAQQVLDFYGDPAPLDYPRLQAFLIREQARLEAAITQRHHLRLKVVRPLYRSLHPSRQLETIPGIGQDSAAIYIAWVYQIQRFPSENDFLGWSGLIPYSSQSGAADAKGLHITQAGPDPIKTTAFLNAGIARLYDPQMAAIYYDQMMRKGKHHNQAICACATHLLSRIYMVLKHDRAYVLRDTHNQPITKPQARSICQTDFGVPAEVRQHNNARVRRQRADERLEKRTVRWEIQKSKG